MKLVFGLALLASGLTMYLAARRLLGRAGGLVAALVYAYLPYLLAVVYARGALPEAVAMALLPLALWAVDLAARPLAAAPALRGGRSGPASAGVRRRSPALAGPPGSLPGGRAAPAGLRGDRRRPPRPGPRPFCLAPGAARGPGPALAADIAAPRQWKQADLYRLFSPAWQAGPGETPLQLGVVAVVLALLAVSERFLGRDGRSRGSLRRSSGARIRAGGGGPERGP